jgi:outer membrane biosynthesis protein TonB
MSAAFWGPHNTTVFYNLALSVAAVLVGQVPAVGPFAGNSILAYLGDLPIPNSGGNFYQYGLSGTLNYWVDIATGSVPWPTSLGAAAATRAAAATTATTAAPAAAAAAVKAPEAPAVSNDAKPESTPASKAPESTPEVKAPESTPEVKAPASTPAADAPESTPEVKAPASTPAADAPASTPAADAPASTPEVKAPADAPAATDTTPAKPARPHPVRDAVEKVGKQISDALGGAKAKAGAAKAGAAATRGSDSAS